MHPVFELKFANVGASAKRAGSRISYREAGNEHEEVVVLLHGIGSNSLGWREVMPSVATKFRVIAWNAPGYYLSEPLASNEPAHKDYAEALGDFLSALGVQRAHVVGSSFGATVAASFAAHYPERVSRLIISGCSAGLKNADPQMRISRFASRREAVEQGPFIFARERVSELIARNASEAVRREAQQLLVAVNPSSFLQAAHAIGDVDVAALGPSISAPTLVIVGEDDRVNPPAVSERIHRAIPHSRLEILADVGHLPKIEAPLRFSELALSHLS